MSESGERGTLTLQTIAMPADTNPSGDIFGGWLMSQMDLGASVLARVRAKRRVATVAVDGMAFHRPVRVGDLVSIYATLVREGTTSMTLEIEAWVTRKVSSERLKVTHATFVFVAVDEAGRKRPLPEGEN
jgi:acyl-CoA thioesterase YciA